MSCIRIILVPFTIFDIDELFWEFMTTSTAEDSSLIKCMESTRRSQSIPCFEITTCHLSTGKEDEH